MLAGCRPKCYLFDGGSIFFSEAWRLQTIQLPLDSASGDIVIGLPPPFQTTKSGDRMVASDLIGEDARRDDARGSDFVSIVVADSTRIHTQLLADALRNDRGLQVVAEASNSAELLAAVKRVPIDVLVISHNLDDQPGHGTQMLREMRALRPQIKGVILLDSSNPQEVLECFRAGARGIFSKQERLETLCKCIRSVHEGQVWARSTDLDHALEALANTPLVHATNHKGIELLSTRERQVIQQLASGMTNREIAVALALSPHTVKNYLFRIFDKLGVSSRTELLYLTMNSSMRNSSARSAAGVDTASDEFSEMLEAAQEGNASAQLHLAEHFCEFMQDRAKAGALESASSDPVSAYMWYLLAERTAFPMLQQIEEGKKRVVGTMSPDQISEAEVRATAWVKSARKQSGVAGDSLQTMVPSSGVRAKERRKIRADAR
jgi:DNA-binding NarL/FixJ family response regulator